MFSEVIGSLDSLVALLTDTIGKGTEGLVDFLLHALVGVGAVAFSVDSRGQGFLLSLGNHGDDWSCKLEGSSGSGNGSSSNEFGLHVELKCVS